MVTKVIHNKSIGYYQILFFKLDGIIKSTTKRHMTDKQVTYLFRTDLVTLITTTLFS